MRPVEASRLLEDELVIEGRLAEASNQVFLAHLESEPDIRVIYKPMSGERELWDFPSGTLSAREVAAYEVDQAFGLDLVPMTVWRTDGVHGPGSVQVVVEIDDSLPAAVEVRKEIHDGMLAIVELEDRSGNEWLLTHRDDDELRRLALFDAIINNGDRKGGHVLATAQGYRAIDHGVSFHVQTKLRTVLWGWAGEPLSNSEIEWLARCSEELAAAEDAVRAHVSANEWLAMESRLKQLREQESFPMPNEDWPSLPWPLF